jgi:hypothetical protein
VTYTIKDHGTWSNYTPNPMPDWAIEASTFGGAVVFLKREGDGVDWYQYRNSNPFTADTVLATTLIEGPNNDEIVKAVFRDPSSIFPFGQRVIEIFGVDPAETKPHNLFSWMTFHPDTLTLSGEPVAPQPPVFKSFVSAAQAKTALYNADLLDKVEEIVKAYPYRPVKIFFESANNWFESDPYVRAIGLELGLLAYDEDGNETDHGFSELFVTASKL